MTTVGAELGENRHHPALGVARLATLRARRICVLKTSSLGDVVQAIPVVHALRQRFPYAHLAWVLNDTFVPLIEPAGIVDEVISFPRDRFRSWNLPTARAAWSYVKLLRRKRFDVVFDLQGLLRSALMAWSTNARIRMGWTSAREGSALFYSHLIDDLPLEQNGVERYWRLAEALGVGHLSKEFPLRISKEERAEVERKLGSRPEPIIAVHPGARWETKRLPARGFAEALNLALPRGEGCVVVLGSEEDRALGEEVAARWKGSALNWVGQTSLRQLAALLARVDLLVTNDSGPMHLAGAVGTPSVGVFTCTSPIRSGVYGSGGASVQTEVSCRASYLKRCPSLICMEDLSSQKLAGAIRVALQSVPITISPFRRVA